LDRPILKTYTYHYPKPSVTTDCIVSRNINSHTEILLIKRLREPYQNQWALPGGFVEIDEDLLEGAQRELLEETGIEEINLKQFKTYGTPGRDPRGRTISVIFYGEFAEQDKSVKAGDDAAEVHWFDMDQLPDLAFDHSNIIKEFRKEKME